MTAHGSAADDAHDMRNDMLTVAKLLPRGQGVVVSTQGKKCVTKCKMPKDKFLVEESRRDGSTWDYIEDEQCRQS